jgi:hypothetical protein
MPTSVLITEATSTVPYSTTSPTGMSSSSGPNVGMDGSNTYTASGSAIVNTNGSLGASSTISVTGPDSNITLVGSEALLTDELTVTASGVPTGTPGMFNSSVTIMGSTASLTGTNFSYVIVNVGYGMAETFLDAEMSAANPADNALGDSECSPSSGSTSPSGLGAVTCTLSFSLLMTYGEPFELATDLDAYVFATPGPGGIAEGGTSDFFDTAQITSIAVDANGNPVTDFSITSASGLDYTANGVFATPEPSGLLFLGIGLLFVALMAKRRLAANVP